MARITDAVGKDLPRKLGKKAARRGAIKFNASKFINFRALPKPPKYYGNYMTSYGMFANDQFGCCVWAGAANETADWHKDVGSEVTFRTEDVLREYGHVTGFDPNRPETDQGTDMAEAASYRRKYGIRDANGKRHKVDAFAKLPVGDVPTLKAAIYYLGGAGIGFLFPSYAMDQFDARKPWAVKNTKRTIIDGGHYVPALGWNAKGNIVCVSWGRLCEMTPGFYERFSDEAVVYLSLDRLYNAKANALLAGKSPEGYKIEVLREAIASVR